MTKYISERSKDPRRKVGAAIVTHNFSFLMYEGHNYIPKGLDENAWLHDQARKLMVIKHAEEDVLEKFMGSIPRASHFFCTSLPCPRCMAKMIERGVQSVFIPEDYKRKEYDAVTFELFERHNKELVLVSGT